MKNTVLILLIALSGLTACNKSTAPAASNPPASSTSMPTPLPKSDALQQKLLEYSGTGATDCGRLDIKVPEAQLKSASDCSLQAAQAKHGFYVAYDMPGMSVGVAGNNEGRLFTVQSQGSGPAPALTSGACPSPLRVASSGRISCFAPGDMTSMGDSHSGGAMPPGMANPHTVGMKNPHTAVAPKTK
ncbi:MAG: hypothetical protein LAO24_11715 [Acidobacteriia bacterium]|nr:hypothetical protein [Terriglobia bacterium]